VRAQAKKALNDSGFIKPTVTNLRQLLAHSSGKRALEIVLRQTKAEHVGIDMLDITICGRPYQDKRKLRRYRRRWKVERTNAWLQNFRRIQVRYDRILSVFQGFFHCACLVIV